MKTITFWELTYNTDRNEGNGAQVALARFENETDAQYAKECPFVIENYSVLGEGGGLQVKQVTIEIAAEGLEVIKETREKQIAAAKAFSEWLNRPRPRARKVVKKAKKVAKKD
jgi:hypothetical protein